MKKTFTALITGATLAAVAGAAFAEPAKSEDLIKWRQSAYQVLHWNMDRLKANIDSPQYNKDDGIKAANTIAAIANSGMGSLFAAGTETGKGWHPTSVKPAFFTDGKKVGEVAVAFNKEANELAKVAATGDAAAVKAQFGKVGQTCKACHDDFRRKD
ncbi:cytochrome c [Rhodocyclus tenuis]|uniref:Cytochrome c n=1 Tax=Rhodocyclus gracilis TaxID=2929842 RepID=A0ABX0WEG2_9RHOO|nr:cytochrome c [Rhodocyclus gracilis]NJA88105.1 cytochrome c [Rhodocyclus gracilis]